MIAEELIEKVTERLVERINRANLFVIKKIAKKIKQIGQMNPSNANDIIQIMEYGGDLESIVKEIAKETELNVKDIYTIFEEVAKNDQRFAKKFYEYKKKRFIPWDENDFLRKEVEAIAEQTAKNYVNISNTRGIGYTIKEMVFDKATGKYKEKTVFSTISDLYKKVVDEGILSISEGKTTFDEELGKLMKQIGRSGLKYLDYESGYSRRIESALRMNISDGLGQLHNRTQEIFGKEFDSDGVEITVHMNPAPDHEEVQGRQFRTKEFDKFQNDEDCVDVKGKEFPADYNGRDRRSISEYNCKHYTFAIVVGVSSPEYTDEQLQDIIDANRKEFEFDGKKYTGYEGTQLQRQLESEIRKNKDIQIMAVESGETGKALAEESQRKIDELTSKYYELSKVSGLSPKIDRLRVEGYKEIDLQDNTSPKPKANRLNRTSEILNKAKFKDYYDDYEKLNKDERFDKVVELDNKFTKEYEPIYEKMDEKTKFAFKRYGGHYYKDINKKLLGLNLDDTDNYLGLEGINNVDEYKVEIDKWTKRIDKTIDESTINEDIVLWKGTKVKYYNKFKEGDIFTTGIYNGTSIDKGVAESFTWNKEDICILKIYCPKGTNGIYISDEIGLGGEQEMLLGRNQKFRYIKSYERMGLTEEYIKKKIKVKIIELEAIK